MPLNIGGEHARVNIQNYHDVGGDQTIFNYQNASNVFNDVGRDLFIYQMGSKSEPYGVSATTLLRK
jgi:hypothetical protein